MTEKGRHISARDLLIELSGRPDFVANRRAADRAAMERDAMLHAAEAPILFDLAERGVRVESTWELIGNRNFPGAAEVLLEHLFRPYPEAVRAAIAKALASQARQADWLALLRAYRQAEEPSIRDGLADALSAIALPDQAPTLTELARDARNGPSRVFLLPGLSVHSAGKHALVELTHDQEIGGEARRILQSLKMVPGRADAVNPEQEELGELGSLSVDSSMLGKVVSRLCDAVAADETCVRRVAAVGDQIQDDETLAIECPSGFGLIRFELYSDDRGVLDLYVFGSPRAGDAVLSALASLPD